MPARAEPAVTVVVPTRGRAPYLRAALASLARSGVDAVEVLVVANGASAVAPEDVAPARLIRLGAVGRSVARNAGVAAARADVVAFLDDDDLSFDGRLALELAALRADRDAVLAFGRVAAIDERGEPLEEATRRERRRFAALLARGVDYGSLLVDCPIFTSSTAVRRGAFLAVGGYDIRLDAYEDLDLYLRLSLVGRLVPCGAEPIAAHRRHSGNTGSHDLYAGAFRLAEKHLAIAPPEPRRLLLERRVDSMWGLGDFRRARRLALHAARSEPRLLSHPRLAKRLLGSALPVSVLRALRERR